MQELLDEEQALGLDRAEYYNGFGERVRDYRSRARRMIIGLKSQGKSIAAYGAAAKGTVLLNYLGLDSQTIDYAVDRNHHKQGKFMPGVRVKIEAPEQLEVERPDYVVILPWNFRDEIIRQQQNYLDAGGRFIVPIPELEIVD